MLIFLALMFFGVAAAQTPRMMYGDATGASGMPFSKDPYVVNFKGRYLMYYSMWKLKDSNDPHSGKFLAIGIAQSSNLNDWKKVGEMLPEGPYEKKGLGAPGALIRDGKVHLFYQTYGNDAKDAICHAVSDDGIHFIRDASNPIFHPKKSAWTNGRAIDADVYFFNGKYFLYFATRDTAGRIQKLGVATAPANTDFSRKDWTQASHDAILAPQLDWEGQCIEAPSIIAHKGKLFMFYAGNYNNHPQQIGVAVSRDGISWERISRSPFLSNGKPGEWNESESGHPDIFEDSDGKTYLFFQGNKDNGKTFYLSNVRVYWKRKFPYLKSAAKR
ncbi:family 43 glycosylhydrolase [Compostibacter hankyongensis]